VSKFSIIPIYISSFHDSTRFLNCQIAKLNVHRVQAGISFGYRNNIFQLRGLVYEWCLLGMKVSSLLWDLPSSCLMESIRRWAMKQLEALLVVQLHQELKVRQHTHLSDRLKKLIEN
jgi:hypothetical protein